MGIGIDEVIKKKFQPQIKFLIIKYNNIILREQEEYENIQEQTRQTTHQLRR